MHELSIAFSLVQLAAETAEQSNLNKVDALRLRLGVFSGVVKEALEFSFDIATEGTMLEGARLIIEEIPLKIFCPQCEKEYVLQNPVPIKCPECNSGTDQILEGKEIELYELIGGG
ncbi:hydrogenase maturation nickel metallochaperone HypA [Ureibacillus thermosphaericus]|uniref:hydrogenase maturation nickel metallochaperone HypA n=1 Tax=Ureibacillus thermosphaericus TaxID=51173 RepID=UPI0030C915DB